MACSYFNLSCFVLATVYVGSFYIRNKGPRNDPENVKRRFFCAFCMLFVSPLFVYAALTDEDLKEKSLPHWLGIRWDGAISAIVLPLCLTAVLFAGPLAMHILDKSWKPLLHLNYWQKSFRNVLWLRNHVIAPVSEEFTFRACMLPQLIKCYTNVQAIFVCPIFFGVAHFHHMIEMYKSGLSITQSLLISSFQFLYTTLFGIYSAFLFLRTGHLIAPCLVHAFCNAMGFPDFGEIFRRRGLERTILASSFVFGLIAWCLLLYPMTEPRLYSNSVYWK